MPPRAAIGLRAHSGWAAAVTILGPPFPPRVIDRRRIVIAEPGAAQPYHAAEPLEFREAQALMDHCRETTWKLAAEAIAKLQTDLEAKGHRPAVCAVLAGSGRKLPDLAGILKSHALIHTAEGEFFREALRDAATAAGLRVAGFPEKTLAEAEAKRFEEISSLGKLIGPPWQMDHKLAALAAWLAIEK